MNERVHDTRSAPSLVSDVLGHVSNLVRKEVDLARSEIGENARKAGLAVGLIAGALIVALVALHVLAAALVAAIAELGIDAGWAALIVGVAFAVIAFAMASKGVKDLKGSSLAPTRTVRNVQRDAEAVREAL